MTKPEFQKLLERYVQGTCTAEEIRQVDRWYKAIAGETNSEPANLDKQAVRDRMWQRISQTVQLTASQPVAVSPELAFGKRYLYWVGMAASIVLLLLLGWGWNRINFVPKEATAERPAQPAAVFSNSQSVQRVQNTTGRNRLLTLEDNSTVLLTPGSRLSFPAPFGSYRREVELVGDAFFEVTKNAKKPFFVYCGGAVAQVLGTSFWVKTEGKARCEAVEVEVKTGKVSVYGQKSRPSGKLSDPMISKLQGVILTPNQKVVFFPDNNHLIPGLVEKPVLITPADLTPTFVYNDTPLTQVFGGLEKGYGIEIIRATENLDSCSFSGDLSDLSLDDKLTLICKSVGASYEVRGTRILVNGPGCTL
ncbi:FecR domain-containing protein [Nibrella saemangeumensis]|uniref:FecR domain-containing protein n=1 Tax=Nibrella saemangeumensis TaxID=1084526 RepID=A0ABP8MRE3_9BACT